MVHQKVMGRTERVIERLNRYADALPADEPLAIGREVERWEVVVWMAGDIRQDATMEQETQRMRAMMDLLEDGKFRFRGHPVVVV